jgi:hypothetical protein
MDYYHHFIIYNYGQKNFVSLYIFLSVTIFISRVLTVIHTYKIIVCISYNIH